MSSSYSANQFDGAFKPRRQQNWCETKGFKERPTAQQGHTTFVVDDRGHLLPGVMKRGSAWPDFKGTWDQPARIPTHVINPTSRSVEGLNRLKSWGIDPKPTGASRRTGAAGTLTERRRQESRLMTGSRMVLTLQPLQLMLLLEPAPTLEADWARTPVQRQGLALLGKAERRALNRNQKEPAAELTAPQQDRGVMQHTK